MSRGATSDEEPEVPMAGKVGFLSMIIAGLAAHVIGQSFTISVGGIDISLILTNAGLLMIFVLSYQWYFDTKVRTELSRDITRDVMGTVRIRDAGLRDIWLESHDVDYKDAILASPELIVGFRHSSSWINRHMGYLRRRCAANLTTHFVILDTKSNAVDCLPGSGPRPYIEMRQETILDRLKTGLGKDLNKIKITYHDRVLSYSFVKSASRIWIKLYRNTEGVKSIPAFEIGIESPLYDFFREDIDRLLDGARAYESSNQATS